jgi:hypothetical protein
MKREGSRFDVRQGQDIGLSSAETRPSLGPMQPPIQRVPADIFPGVKWLKYEPNYVPRLCLGQDWEKLCLSFLPTSSLRGAQLSVGTIKLFHFHEVGVCRFVISQSF